MTESREPFQIRDTASGTSIIRGHTVSPVRAASDSKTGATQFVLAVWKKDPAFDPLDNADSANRWPITAVSPGSNGWVEIAGNFTATGTKVIYDGMHIAIDGSTGNDGRFRARGVSAVSGATRIHFAFLPDSTVDGDVVLLVPYHAIDSGFRMCCVNRDLDAVADEYTMATVAWDKSLTEWGLLGLGCNPGDAP